MPKCKEIFTKKSKNFFIIKKVNIFFMIKKVKEVIFLCFYNKKKVKSFFIIISLYTVLLHILLHAYVLQKNEKSFWFLHELYKSVQYFFSN